jgi:thymidylate kinase
MTICNHVSLKRGRFVILVGPDGVGKTTVARAIIEHHTGPTAYFHFLPPVWGSLARTPDLDCRPPVSKGTVNGSRVLGWCRLLRNAARCWLAYVTTVRPALRRNCVVVGDRWMYGYLVQPHALKFHGPELLARVVLCLLPRPHLVVNLAAPPHLIRARKQELTLTEIERELFAWSSLPLVNFHTIDAARPPEVIGREILVAVQPGVSGQDALEKR